MFWLMHLGPTVAVVAILLAGNGLFMAARWSMRSMQRRMTPMRVRQPAIANSRAGWSYPARSG